MPVQSPQRPFRRLAPSPDLVLPPTQGALEVATIAQSEAHLPEGMTVLVKRTGGTWTRARVQYCAWKHRCVWKHYCAWIELAAEKQQRCALRWGVALAVPGEACDVDWLASPASFRGNKTLPLWSTAGVQHYLVTQTVADFETLCTAGPAATLDWVALHENTHTQTYMRAPTAHTFQRGAVLGDWGWKMKLRTIVFFFLC
jgi:hypothetical protein